MDGREMRRKANLTPLSRRVTPREVAQLWFRRGADFAVEIRVEYPDFPLPGPDGLFLLAQVEAWFDRFHGQVSMTGPAPRHEEEAAMRAALGQG